MSYKRNLLKLLQQTVTPIKPIQISSKNTETLNPKRLERSKKRKVKRLNLKRKENGNLLRSSNKSIKQSNNVFQNVISSDDSQEIDYSVKEELVTSYSDSDIEINIRKPSVSDWKNEIKTNISPSKSEHEKDSPKSDIGVDTIYHNPDKSDRGISLFSDSEKSDSDYYEEVENVIFSEATAELNILEQKKLSVIKYYNMSNGKIIVLKNKDNLYIHGSFALTVLYGNVQLLGYNLTPFCNIVEVHSLRGFSYLYLQNIHEGDCRPANHALKIELNKMGISRKDVKDICCNLEPCDSIVICSSLQNYKLPYLEKHISQKLLPVEENICAVVKNDEPDLNVVKHNPRWDDIVKVINKRSKLMICGGKGVGKSTLLRYMVNKLVMNFNSVLVIDLDPGQSEFTIPGCVSAVIVKKPIFGPNFTHLQKPERCILVENIDVTLEPDMYINSVAALLRQCRHFSNMPTIINYMGYSQSYGINIVSSVISYVGPTILLQINSTQNTKNYVENLTPAAVKRNLHMFKGNDRPALCYEYIIIDSMCDGLTSWQAQGRVIREMCILSYFSTLLDRSLSLTSTTIPLYKISLKDITLESGNSKMVTNKSAIFNASLVSLCTVTDTPNIYNCHGWGIVRGIDEEMLVLITPIEEDILDTVTHFVVGSVTLPPSMLMYEDENVGLAPYVSLGCISTFNSIPKRSYLYKKC